MVDTNSLEYIYMRGISKHKYLYKHVNVNKHWKLKSQSANFVSTRVINVNTEHAGNYEHRYL